MKQIIKSNIQKLQDKHDQELNKKIDELYKNMALQPTDYMKEMVKFKSGQDINVFKQEQIKQQDEYIKQQKEYLISFCNETVTQQIETLRHGSITLYPQFIEFKQNLDELNQKINKISDKIFGLGEKINNIFRANHLNDFLLFMYLQKSCDQFKKLLTQPDQLKKISDDKSNFNKILENINYIQQIGNNAVQSHFNNISLEIFDKLKRLDKLALTNYKNQIIVYLNSIPQDIFKFISSFNSNFINTIKNFSIGHFCRLVQLEVLKLYKQSYLTSKLNVGVSTYNMIQKDLDNIEMYISQQIIEFENLNLLSPKLKNLIKPLAGNLRSKDLIRDYNQIVDTYFSSYMKTSKDTTSLIGGLTEKYQLMLPNYIDDEYNRILSSLESLSDNNQEYYTTLIYYAERNGKNRSFGKNQFDEMIKYISEQSYDFKIDNLILISDKKLTGDSKKKINNIKGYFENAVGFDHREIFNSIQILIDPTEHYLVPKHIILSPKEEFELVISNFELDPNQLPNITTQDAVIKFQGGKKNQIVKIERTNFLESTTKSLAYRLIVSPSYVRDLVRAYEETVSLEEQQLQEQQGEDQLTQGLSDGGYAPIGDFNNGAITPYDGFGL
jgi:DNA-directed RNA polymerase subunit H (RpoH/RPB5)